MKIRSICRYTLLIAELGHKKILTGDCLEVKDIHFLNFLNEKYSNSFEQVIESNENKDMEEYSNKMLPDTQKKKKIAL